jgi:hypothetical protein
MVSGSDAMEERGLRSRGFRGVGAAGFSQQPVLREAPVEREYVGIDCHRRRSVPVRRDAMGASLGVARVVNTRWCQRWGSAPNAPHLLVPLDEVAPGGPGLSGMAYGQNVATIVPVPAWPGFGE